MSPPKNPDSRPLPEGWIEQWDSNHNTWFYVDTRKTPPVSSWTHPANLATSGPSSYAPPSGAPPGFSQEKQPGGFAFPTPGQSSPYGGPAQPNHHDSSYGAQQGGYAGSTSGPSQYGTPGSSQYAAQGEKGPGKLGALGALGSLAGGKHGGGGGGGTLGKLFGKLGGGGSSGKVSGGYGGGYGGGYAGQPAGYYGQQQPIYVQQGGYGRPGRGGGGGMGMGGMALGAGAGVLGGALLADAIIDGT
ncbi:hypothetical protein BKA62DRAFT_689181 [Auriculariales sp. MPI-PUGE-AT-0066]|nr:hypothetical protein BKA62DRAFT_689181 [Auriculariales sp. MPI-PUGE-AT-0066]